MSNEGSNEGSAFKLPDEVTEMLDDLVESGEAGKMEGLDIHRLKAAMSAPGAAEVVAEIRKLGAGSPARVGQTAAECELP